jgi:hypothetical protein
MEPGTESALALLYRHKIAALPRIALQEAVTWGTMIA